jgi:hypothetical protein
MAVATLQVRVHVLNDTLDEAVKTEEFLKVKTLYVQACMHFVSLDPDSVLLI